VAIGDHLSGLGFTSFYIFECPVNRLPGWFLVYSGCKSDD
jgi:hypothetical protein